MQAADRVTSGSRMPRPLSLTPSIALGRVPQKMECSTFTKDASVRIEPKSAATRKIG